MSITVNLMTTKKGELKRFLDSYFEEDSQTDSDVMEWIYIYNRPKDALRVIDVFSDNGHKFDISLWVQVGDEDIIAFNERSKHEILNDINNFKSNIKCLEIE